MLPGDGRCRRKRSWTLHTQVQCGPAGLQHELHEIRTKRSERDQKGICMPVRQDMSHLGVDGCHL